MPAINRNSGAAIHPTNCESTYALPSRKSIRVNELNAWHWIMITTAKPRIQSRKGNLFTRRRAAQTPSDAHYNSGNSGGARGCRLRPNFRWVTRASRWHTIHSVYSGCSPGCAHMPGNLRTLGPLLALLSTGAFAQWDDGLLKPFVM